MVWCKLANDSGQVVKNCIIKDTSGSAWTVGKSKRLGINRYEIELKNGEEVMYVTNHQIKTWSFIKMLTPEEIARQYGRKLDPDANLPRPMRESFWKMQSKPGTHNYKQKKRLMQLLEYQKFSKYFDSTVID